MNYSDEYIIELSKAAIFNYKPINPLYELDWNYIFDKSIEQNIAGLIFPSLVKLDDEFKPNSLLIERWKKVMYSNIEFNSNMYNEFMKMINILKQYNIIVVGLKGCVLRNIYPTPELRSMGDFDVLVKKNDLKKIVEIFKENNYIISKDAFGITCKNKDAYWEIFYTLEEEFRNSFNIVDELAFNYNIETDFVNMLEYTIFLAHLIIHTGKHYVREGAGIRNICDIALFINKFKDYIDFEKVRKICIDENFENIYYYIMNSVKYFFDVDMSEIKIEKKNYKLFIEYMLLNGVFGKSDNTVVFQVSKNEDDSVKGIRKLLFPSVKLLDYRYKYLKKMPFLLPFAWVHRFFSAIFKHKYSLKTMIYDTNEAIKFSYERLERLERLGIKDKH